MNPAQAYQGQLDGFVSKFASAGTLAYSTYHGGAGMDTLEGIGVDAAGNVNTVGSTTSTNLPVLNAARPDLQRPRRRVHLALRADRHAALLLLLRRFAQRRRAGPWRCLPDGWAFVAGSTASPDFPVASPIQPAFGGELDAFLLAVSPTGAIAWATYYGGTRSERGRALALNPSGKLIFAGQTFSPDMPLIRPAQPRTGGNRDTFVVELDPPYTAFTYATYLGGSNNDEGSGVAVDRVGRVFTAGAASYPSPGALGASDAFVYGISSGLAGVDTDGDGLDDEWETQFGTDPNSQRRRRGSGWRRLHQRPGAGQQHASDRLLHPLPRRRIDGRVLRRSHRAVQSGGRPRHRGAALPARRRRRDPAGPGHPRAQPRHGQPRDDRRPRERRLCDRDREQPVGGRRPHDDLGRQRLRQPRRDVDRAAGDNLVPGRRLNLRHLQSLLPAAEPERQRGRGDHHLPAPDRWTGHQDVHRRPAEPLDHQHRHADGLRGTSAGRTDAAVAPTFPRRSSRPTACRSWSSARCT